jgi:hypothetical protein
MVFGHDSGIQIERYLWPDNAGRELSTVPRSSTEITLGNGLVSVLVDGDHGGVLSSLRLATGGGLSKELLKGFGDDVMYWDDKGDVYGAFFGQERARESQVRA